jgi:hypothetical protein
VPAEVDLEEAAGPGEDAEAIEMLHTLWGVIHNGKVELSEQVDLPEGTKLLVTVLPDDEKQFWLAAGEKSAAAVWDNAEDDVSAQLLEG